MTPFVQRAIPRRMQRFAKVLGINVLDEPFNEPSSDIVTRVEVRTPTLPSLYDASGTAVRCFTLTHSQALELTENPRGSNAARLARGIANEFQVRVKLEFEGKTIMTCDPR